MDEIPFTGEKHGLQNHQKAGDVASKVRAAQQSRGIQRGPTQQVFVVFDVSRGFPVVGWLVCFPFLFFKLPHIPHVIKVTSRLMEIENPQKVDLCSYLPCGVVLIFIRVWPQRGKAG